MKAVYADREGEFISTKLKGICKKKGIIIKCIAAYIYEKNGFTE